MQIREQQSRDSVRVVWNVMASSRAQQAKAAVPQAIHYTPLQQRQQVILDHFPPQCKKCEAFMNPYNRIHFNKTEYTCCVCKTSSKLPENYLNGQETYPPEMSLNYSSFVITQKIANSSKKMGYLFVVDICIEQRQLESVKQSILNLVSHLSDDEAVGLITYNKFAHLYDLTSKMGKVHSFSPYQTYETMDIATMLDIKHSQSSFRYINVLGQCRQAFTRVVKMLSKIKHVSYKHQREARATGLALNLALSLNELAQDLSRIVFFCGGPCTIGSGKLIEQDYKIEMRSIKDQTPKLSKTAQQYYRLLATKAKSKLIPIDSFIFSVQEAGLTEMKELLSVTGGLLVQHEEFNSKIFKESFKKAYIGLGQYPPFQTAAYSSINVKCSPQIVITQNFIDKQEKKESETTIVLGELDQSRTVTFTFELADVNTDLEAYYMQIRTTYRYPANLSIKFQRITTIRRLFGNFAGDLASGFDQGAALALLAKLSIGRSLSAPSDELRQWLDNILCKWAALFGNYRVGEADSFRLVDNIKLFPQFVYHLRRNSIVRRSGLSLDEYIYLSEIIKKQTVENIILIIQPALLEYTSQHHEMHPVSLDERYMKSQSVLVLDSFFNVVQWRGRHIESLANQSEHQSEEFKNVAKFLQNAESDVQNIKSDRFPVPHYYLTSPGHSKERFIKSRLSSREHDQHEINLSDEVDVNAFTQKLIELVVNKKL